MFNSREYEWNDVHALIGGRLITRLRSVRYKRSKEKELVYGAGNEPVSIPPKEVPSHGGRRGWP